VRNFDPNCYLYLSRASDWFDIVDHAPGRSPSVAKAMDGRERPSEAMDGGERDPKQSDGSVAAALQQIRIERALVIGVTTDILFPLTQQQQIADGLRAAGAEVDFVPLDSPQGHDAFLVDIVRFGAAISAFLARL
jgi:homoserine O-acetyltransferase